MTTEEGYTGSLGVQVPRDTNENMRLKCMKDLVTSRVKSNNEKVVNKNEDEAFE